MTASEDLRAVCDDYWEARLRASPLYASFLGDHRFDDQADDLSAAADQAHRATWVGLRTRLDGVATGDLDDTDAATRQLLAQELDEAVRSIDLRLVELASDQMEGPHVDLLMLAAQLRAPDPEAAAMAVTRTVAFGTMLDQAAERFREGLAAGRTPARINIERSLNILDGYLATDIVDDPFVRLAGPDDWDGEAAVARRPHGGGRRRAASRLRPLPRRPRRRAAARRPSRRSLRPALARRGRRSLPGARSSLHTGLPLTPQELHEVGLHEITETLPGGVPRDRRAPVRHR